MLCRAIFTAIVISCTSCRELTAQAIGQGVPPLDQIKDVICVLLLSGLQKEDLDINTLAKLRSHNVNIYDLNNENLRQECSLRSYTKTVLDISQLKGNKVQSNASTPSISTQNYADKSIISEPQNSRIPDDTYTDIDNIKVTQKESNRRDSINEPNEPTYLSVTNFPEIKKENVENIKRQPSLENILIFWQSLAEKEKTNSVSVTKSVTTASTQNPRLLDDYKPVVTTQYDNKGYAHSKESEYVNRLISEYLASDTVPTTTVSVITKSTKNAKHENIDVTNILNNLKEIFEENSAGLNALTKFDSVLESNNKPESNTGKGFPKKIVDYINKDRLKQKLHQLEIPQSVPSEVVDKNTPKSVDRTLNIDALQLIESLLRTNNNLGTTKRSVNSADANTYEANIRRKIEEENHSTKLPLVIQNTEKIKEQVTGLPDKDMILAIAEQIKDIVLENIKKGSTIEKPTSTDTYSTTEKSKPLKTENDGKDNVLQSLMALFTELNSTREKTTENPKVTEEIRGNTARNTLQYPSLGQKRAMYPTDMVNFKPSDARSAVDPWRNLVPIPLGPDNREQIASFLLPTNLKQQKPFQSQAKTMQTNLQEIPPLPIPVANPNHLHQYILVTTQSTPEKNDLKRQQRLDNVGSERNYHRKKTSYGDLTKSLRTSDILNKEPIDSYKDKIQRLRDRIRLAQKSRQQMRQLAQSRAEQSPSHRIDLNRLLDSGGLSHLIGSNTHYTVNRPQSSSYHGPMYHDINMNQRRLINQDHRDLITREMLERLADSNHRDAIRRLVESYPSLINRPLELNHQSDSHHSDTYARIDQDRAYPRQNEHTYHEPLDRVQNWASDYDKMTTGGSCGQVAERQQVPLTNIKNRPRFDDKHFKNFLQSQQKVTDMLEKILASKTNRDAASDETFVTTS